MNYDQWSNIFCIIANLLGIGICLYRYIRWPRKMFLFALIFCLSNLLSNYYWGIYVLTIGADPDTSSVYAYMGWNISVVMLHLMVYFSESNEHKKFISPLAFLPIPLNIYQFLVHVRFGGIFNNAWQGIFATLASCISINNIAYWYKNKKNGTKMPYLSVVVLFYIVNEYIMWTSSCFDWPSAWLHPYNYSSILMMLCYILVPLAIAKEYSEKYNNTDAPATPFQKKIRYIYTVIVTFLSFGGYLFAVWMKNTLSEGVTEITIQSHRVIAAMLFADSMVIVLLAVIVVMSTNYFNKKEENKLMKEEKTSAEKANAVKSDFLANMSHEIRTPINAVLGMNEMMLQKSLEMRDKTEYNPIEVRGVFIEMCQCAGNVDSAGRNLLAIINDILDISKIEAGKMEIMEADYKLSNVLNDIKNMIQFKARSKSLEFEIVVDKIVPDGLHGDEVRIRQILTNLLNNAVKYTDRGGIVLEIEVKEHEDDKDIADFVYKIKDTGRGIKSEDMKKLFEKFERVDLEKNKTIEGAGLGLVITKNLLDMMGGSIDIDSVYEKGSIFTVTIPQKIVSREPIGDFKHKFEKNIDKLHPQGELFKSNADILIVDDTKVNIVVAQGLLKNTGLNIDFAYSGDEAIEKTMKKKYDLILMDQRMPMMDGTTAMYLIKSDANNVNTDTPFICLTADALRGARERYMAAGFDDYLTKPMNSSLLKSTIVKYLPKEKVQIAV